MEQISCAAVTRLVGAAKRLPIAQLGVRYKGKQRIEIKRPMLAEVVANFRKRDTGEVPIDYDHAIETAAGSGNPVPAAGWIKSIDDTPDGQGILWGTVQWTPKASRMIEAGEYKYISPVIDPTVRDNKTGEAQGWTLTSAALTNLPVLQGMPALVLSETGRQSDTKTEAGRVNRVRNENQGGYLDQEWNPVQRVINSRVQGMMAADKRLDWAAAFEAVMAADPSLAQRSLDAINVEISRRVKEMLAGNKALDYGRAQQTVFLADQHLFREYRAATQRVLSASPVNPELQQVDAELLPLVQERIKASACQMDYGAALRVVLNERPDLLRRRQTAMR